MPSNVVSNATKTPRQGMIYALACYLSWGFVPLFWKSLHTLPATEILAHRIVWSCVFFCVLLAYKKRIQGLFTALRNGAYFKTYLLSAALIGINWITYIWAVNSDHLLESSLGYFINPLVNVLLGLIFLKEKLRLLQWVAVASAAIGVLFLTTQADHFPIVAFVLALSFGFYGLVRKRAPLDPLLGSGLESLALAPVALCYLGFLFVQNEGAFGHVSAKLQILLALGGAVTALPLLWFAEAASRLKLSTLGFFQYLSPTFQFLIAVFIYNEPLTQTHIWSFGFIWLGLGIFIKDSLRVKERT